MGLTDEDLARILENDVAGVLALLPDLSPADVVRLQELEILGGARDGLVDAINAHIEAQQSEAQAAAAATKRKSKPAARKTERGEEIPDELKPDYNGPMTIDLAERRRRFFEMRGK